jgi:hypothetical protein
MTNYPQEDNAQPERQAESLAQDDPEATSQEAGSQPEDRPEGADLGQEARRGEDPAIDRWFQNWQTFPTVQEREDLGLDGDEVRRGEN